MPDHGTVTLDKHRLRLWEQATFAYRGAWIPLSMKTTITPAWRVRRERIAAQVRAEDTPRLRRVR